MKRILLISLLIGQVFLCQQLFAQETEKSTERDSEIKQKKEQVIKEEKEALKKEVLAINTRLNKGEITQEEAVKLKVEAAEIHALNIENKIAIIDNSVALSERAIIKIKDDDVNIELRSDPYRLKFEIFDDEESTFDFQFGYKKKYEKRTRSNFVMAFGFSNAISDGESFDKSPYNFGRSRFFEMGWAWSTRVLNNSNAIRFRYGFSFSFDGLIPTDNQYFVQDGDLTYLETYDYKLRKAKLRVDKLFIPIHFEFGPSKKRDRGDYVSYSKKRFKFGIGGFTGFKIGSRQKLKYTTPDGGSSKEKIKKSYNTPNLIYGLSSYIGYHDFSFYTKYELNNIFNEPNPKENMIAMGLRFDW